MPIIRTRQVVRHPLRRYVARVRGMGQDTSVGLPSFGDQTAPIDVTLPENFPIDIAPLPSPVTPPAQSPTTTPSSGNTLQQILNAFNQAAGGAINIYRQTQQPALVAGTQAVYNPATGQFYNPVTGQVVSPQQTSAFPVGMPFDPTTMLVIGGVVIGGILLVSLAGRRG
jgi:hypothetical protein